MSHTANDQHVWIAVVAIKLQCNQFRFNDILKTDCLLDTIWICLTMGYTGHIAISIAKMMIHLWISRYAIFRQTPLVWIRNLDPVNGRFKTKDT